MAIFDESLRNVYGTIERSDLFGAGIFGPELDEYEQSVLGSEEEYGDWQDPILTAEEEYVDDADAYGAEHDDEDGDLNALDEEMSEDLYGAHYGVAGVLRAPVGFEQDVQQIAAAIGPGIFLPEFARQASAAPGWIEWAMEGMADQIRGSEPEEIATYLVYEPTFSRWASMSIDQKRALLAEAVKKAALPGLEAEWDEPFRKAWSQGQGFTGTAWGVLKASPSAVWNLVTKDVPTSFFATIRDMAPLAGPVEAAMRAAGVNSPDQWMNGYAIRLYMLSLARLDVYGWMAKSIDRQASAAVSRLSASLAPRAPAPVVEETEIIALPEPEVIAPPTGGLPRPQTILAFGYATLTVGSLLGFFK